MLPALIAGLLLSYPPVTFTSSAFSKTCSELSLTQCLQFLLCFTRSLSGFSCLLFLQFDLCVLRLSQVLVSLWILFIVKVWALKLNFCSLRRLIWRQLFYLDDFWNCNLLFFTFGVVKFQHLTNCEYFFLDSNRVFARLSTSFSQSAKLTWKTFHTNLFCLFSRNHTTFGHKKLSSSSFKKSKNSNNVQHVFGIYNFPFVKSANLPQRSAIQWTLSQRHWNGNRSGVR